MTESTGTPYVLIHVSNVPEDLARGADNARLVAEQFPGARVRIVINGEALEGLRDPALIAVPDGVEVGACGIGISRRGIDAAALPAGVDVLPGAIPAIVEAQLAGAMYIRL